MRKIALLLLIQSIPVLAAAQIAIDQAPSSSTKAYLFTSFRGNGEDGLHLAYSLDGYKWEALHNDESFLQPRAGNKLMRDPCLRRAPDGIFHMVWTTGWKEKGFGYASSQDLMNWSEQVFVPITEELKGTMNTWAPELFYDQKKNQWLIIWATTVEGFFPEIEKDDGGFNHRQYYTTTRDFKVFSEAKLFFDPGYNCIDGTLIEEGGKYHFIFKDERVGMKCLRRAVADNPEGPFSPATEPFTRDWVEGPSAVKMGEEWFVFFDHYAAPQFYGAVKSKDLLQWEDISEKMVFPKDFRHGTVIQIGKETLDGLLR